LSSLGVLMNIIRGFLAIVFFIFVFLFSEIVNKGIC